MLDGLAVKRATVLKHAANYRHLLALADGICSAIVTRTSGGRSLNEIML